MGVLFFFLFFFVAPSLRDEPSIIATAADSIGPVSVEHILLDIAEEFGMGALSI